MSTALAVQPASGTTATLDKLFDFEASHARATLRLRKALDGNGAAAADLVTVSRSQQLQRIIVLANVESTYSWRMRTFAGGVRGNVRFVDRADLETVADRNFAEFAARPEHVEQVVSQLASSPAKGFASPETVELGAIPTSFASQRHCNACGGKGECNCSNWSCLYGKVSCHHCSGKQWVYGYSGSDRVKCNVCYNGKINCPECLGLQRVGCGDCNRTGIFTTLRSGSVQVNVAYQIETADGHDKDWTSALTKSGHAWLADAGLVAKSTVERGVACATVGWAVDVPILGQVFRVGEKEFRARYVGRRERMWSMPRFLDHLVRPLAARIEAAQPAEAFKLAGQAPVFAGVSRGVLHAPRTDEAVAGDFENAVSPGILAGVRAKLEAKRDGIARSTIHTVWKYAGVALTIGSLIALASGQTRALLGAAMPDLQRSGMEGSAAVAGGMILAALLAATWLLAGFAGRSAVRAILQTKAARLPDQGRAPIYACIAALAVYGAGAYLVSPSATPPSTRTVGVASASRMPTVRPPTIPPFYR